MSASPFCFRFSGLLALPGALWREASPKYARPGIGNYIWAGILIIIGLCAFVAFKITWPLVLLAVGLALLADFLFWRR